MKQSIIAIRGWSGDERRVAMLVRRVKHVVGKGHCATFSPNPPPPPVDMAFYIS